ncbi:unnamed protein product [Rotaria sp. Silwood1]|nr:unnamed protein product [Rotaria sp. Silwood1]
MEGHDDKRQVAINGIHVETGKALSTSHNEPMNKQRQVISSDVKIQTNSSNEFEMVPHRLNGEETLDQRQVVLTLKRSDDIPADPMTKNRRFIDAPTEKSDITTTNTINNFIVDLDPIIGYADEPLLPLFKACAPLTDIIYNLSFYIQLALNETPDHPPNGLTVDESAAIRLYTIEWEGPHRSLYSMLNHALIMADRKNLRPYFGYLKLYLTALVKVPCIPPLTVWRGVTKDISAQYPPGTSVTWWAFSSCTTSLPVLENNMYLGNMGNRTLFSIEAVNGRSIRTHSHFVTEDEIILLPGTRMEVQSQFSPASNLHIIHLKQVIPEEVLLEPPFKGILNIVHHSFRINSVSLLRSNSLSKSEVSPL